MAEPPRDESVGTWPAPVESAAVRIRGMSKVYATRSGRVTALEDVSLDVKDREFVCLVGPSGCGKTTVLKSIAGLVAPSTGEITVFDHPVSGPYPGVGVVFQSPVLLRWRTVLDNVLLPAQILRLDRRAARRRAEQLLELVGLGGFEQTLPRELSGGMQQRVSIARALLHDPRLLLFDEPFGALDQITREYMNEELTRIWQHTQKTTFLITHSIDEAVFLGDRVFVMSPRPGRISDLVPIEIPRPRSPDVRLGEDFIALKARIEHQVRRDDPRPLR